MFLKYGDFKESLFYLSHRHFYNGDFVQLLMKLTRNFFKTSFSDKLLNNLQFFTLQQKEKNVLLHILGSFKYNQKVALVSNSYNSRIL